MDISIFWVKSPQAMAVMTTAMDCTWSRREEHVQLTYEIHEDPHANVCPADTYIPNQLKPYPFYVQYMHLTCQFALTSYFQSGPNDFSHKHS